MQLLLLFEAWGRLRFLLFPSLALNRMNASGSHGSQLQGNSVLFDRDRALDDGRCLPETEEVMWAFRAGFIYEVRGSLSVTLNLCQLPLW
jgi:hypothetical protein